MRLRLIGLWQTLRASYWFLPAVLALAAVLLAAVTLRIDDALSREQASTFDWLYTGGASGARDVLAAIAGSTIAVAGTTFSITIAVLQLTSGQFGPRLLRNFMRDTGNQLVLGTFTASFLYSLLVLRRVRGLDDLQFVPHLSVTVGFALGVLSVGVLIYFIHHIASSIQAANVIATVSRELEQGIARLFPEEAGRRAEAAAAEERAQAVAAKLDDKASRVACTGSGYIAAVDSTKLMKLAGAHDVVLRLLQRPGDFAAAGQPLMEVWPPERLNEALARDLQAAVALANERSPVQDVLFPVNQLVEIASRALSSGINDPFTAITCIDRLSAGLCLLFGRELPSAYRFDQGQRLRLIAEPVSYEAVVDAAFDQIRRYGRGDVTVMARLLEAITRVAACARTDTQRLALARQAEMVHRAGREQAAEERDRLLLDERYAAARVAIGTVPTAVM